MKSTFSILFILCILIGCNNQQLTHKEAVTDYYNARSNANFNELKKLVSDSVTIISGDYIMPYDPDGFYEVFKWDSVFKPSYKVVELVEKNSQILVTVELSSIKNEFLKNNEMLCQYNISFDSGKISKIEELACKNADWEAWQVGVNSLVNWTEQNHPELNGFINDMTMKGAQNYVKAIELFETDKNTLE
ncbi:hypothetical protein [Spongiivirga citrea]|uniref:Uncharacterized protein n=1 Tax=Spongiivirga citrea TaxID=1481457 RepID=A0A6M0CRP3_9FLAO|nr:hypothetical protein [Spongiivirga citrea]NER16590.1 hypothetical protein [Spongiivirga citrea]